MSAGNAGGERAGRKPGCKAASGAMPCGRTAGHRGPHVSPWGVTFTDDGRWWNTGAPNGGKAGSCGRCDRPYTGNLSPTAPVSRVCTCHLATPTEPR